MHHLWLSQEAVNNRNWGFESKSSEENEKWTWIRTLHVHNGMVSIFPSLKMCKAANFYELTLLCAIGLVRRPSRSGHLTHQRCFVAIANLPTKMLVTFLH